MLTSYIAQINILYVYVLTQKTTREEATAIIAAMQASLKLFKSEGE